MKNYYCLIGIGNVSNMENVLLNVINGKFYHLDLKKIFISTFESDYQINEIENFLVEFEKSFFLSKMSPENFTAFIYDTNIQTDLFGDYISKMIKLNNDISDTKSSEGDWEYFDFKASTSPPPHFFYDLNDEEMMKREFNTLKNKKHKESTPTLNDLLDRIGEVGYENLTEKEKEYLKKYSEN